VKYGFCADLYSTLRYKRALRTK